MMIYNSSLAEFVANFNFAIKHHKNSFHFIKSKTNSEIIKCLIQEGIFMYSEPYKKYREIVYLNTNKKPYYVRLISKPSIIRFYKVSQIKCINNLHQIHIFSTNKGIMNGIEAMENNIGGKYLLKVSYL